MCKICTGKIHKRNLDALRVLDVSYCTDLTSEKLQEILIQCKNLITLSCHFCRSLTSLDLRNNINLETLLCYNCTSLTSLDLRSNINLIQLEHSNCISLTSLDLRNNISLEILRCFSCKSLTSLDLRNNINLTILLCSYCTSLISLDLRNNKNLKELDVTSCSSLTNLHISEDITNLDCDYSPWISLNEDFINNLQNLIKLQRWWKRLLIIKYLKSREFIEWIYSPNNIGGRLHKSNLLKNLTNF